MKNVLYILALLCFSIFVIGCTKEESNNKNQKEESTLNEDQLYDIYFLKKAPKATDAHDLSEVIKVVATSSNGENHDTIAIDVENKFIHIDPWVSTAGVTSLEESSSVEGMEQVIDILETYQVQDWKENYSTEDEQTSTEDGAGWSLYLQFEDGSVEEHKGTGTSMHGITPENFDDFYAELEKFVDERLDVE